MAKPARTSEMGTYFVTSTTYGRRRLFQVTANAELFMQTLEHYRAEGNFRLHAFVFMPDHVHLLLTTQGVTLERALGLIKGSFSHRLHSSFTVWQRGFTDHRLRNVQEFRENANTSIKIPCVRTSSNLQLFIPIPRLASRA